MIKKVLILVAVLMQIGLFSIPVSAGEAPEPTCWPCSR
jgi:hypothetical protein